MAYELKVTRKPAYLHFIVTGQNSKETIERYVDEINRECVARKCFRILIEESLDGPRLSIMDVFELIQKGTSKYRGIFKTIAYVDVNAIDNSMKFAEDACVNRALPMAVFTNVPDAEKWLMNKNHRGTRPHAEVDTDKPRR
ncbi:MAG: hypothetical protein NTW65_10880 [Deltaproteobacteria bacterium]|nr:hypothetical protein [Deltaproteobacteria bacterium]